MKKTGWKIAKGLIWCTLSILALGVLIVPYFVLGHGVYIQMTDQLDGEVLNYIYNAKYLFTGSEVIPELMNGVSSTAMMPPAPMGVWLYKVLSPFDAFAVMHISVLIAGFVGMYLLARELTNSDFVAFVTAGFFVYLPFYPVYGLSILGQPLLVWALIKIYKTGGRKQLYYLAVLLYAACSSLALVGFAWIVLLALTCIIMALYRNSRFHSKKSIAAIGVADIILLFTYLICNLNLVRGMLGIGDKYVPHRDEMILAPLEFWENFTSIFFEGGSYAKSYNLSIFIMATAVVSVDFLIGLVGKKYAMKEKESSCAETENHAGLISGLLIVILSISVLAALWRTELIVDIRMSMSGVLKSFQADRIYWILPLLWYIVLALCIDTVWKYVKGSILILIKKTAYDKIWFGRVLSTLAVCVGSVCILGFLVYNIYENSTVYHNLRLMIFPDTYHLMTWDDYYAEDVFTQIDEFIGQDKEDYRTVSLGITPAAALYNGFYCLDGYSNYYPLEYKHEFREIIAAELEELEETKVYFDAWGNRCYMFTGETGNFMMIPKTNDGHFEHLDLNTGKLYQMGARFVFSAMPIDNAEEINLELLREEPFETEQSYYRIWLYAVNEQ